MAEEDLAAATNWLSACEQRSVKAERKVISIKKARFMRKFEGEEFDGIISSVAKFGVFVLLRQYDVDGLIRIENLGNDRFMFDEENLRLIGQRTGKRFVIGDQIRIQVVNANPEDGRIDFVLAEDQKESSEHDDDEHDGSEFDFSDLDEFGDLKIRETTMGHSHKTKGKSQVRGKESGRGGVSGGKKANRKELKAKRFGDKKRSPPENDSRGVRKKRLSKRR
jgi:ribonuclease R